jgi:glycosyltransferase involved in cell wall biosynthesis
LLYRPSLSHCGLIFTTGKSDQTLLLQLLGRPVHHLPSAPLDLFYDMSKGAGQSACDVISVANFFPKKRLDLVLECAKHRPQLRFVVLGDGPEREELLAKATAENVRNIAFPGRCSPTQVAKAMQGAKLFLLTSEEEGTPTAALEAMAVGLPVVLTPSNNYEWLVEAGVNGFVTSSWEVDEIVIRIDDVVSNEANRAEMGRINRERVLRNHSWRTNAEQVNALMAKYIGMRSKVPCNV